jgi:hypothetical protein
MKSPQSLVDEAGPWEELHRWERAELGRALRRRGISYGEIRELIPAPKGTLSNWCREIQLSPAQTNELNQGSDALCKASPSRYPVEATK